jgi:hypothetical protein
MEKPIIGVFINHSVIRKLKKQETNFDSYPRILELVKSSIEANKTLYFFSIRTFYFIKKQVLGTFYNSNTKRWEQKEFPLPDVLYNRRGGGGQSTNIANDIEKTILEHGAIKLNSQTYFDKWEVFQELSKYPVMKYLPETVEYKNELDLFVFLFKHGRAYLKGTRGGKGRWIFRVRKLQDGTYEYSYFNDEVVMGHALCWFDLITKINKFYGSRKFIIQKTINLLEMNDRKVDFRAELQRNGTGNLEIMGVCARLGQSNSPITIHSSAYPFEKFLSEFLHYSDEKVNEMTEKVHEFLISIYTSLEDVYGIFGEIGIDFGLDEDGNIWFIEPNSKSAKVSLMKAYDYKTVHQVFLNPILFSEYLYKKKFDLMV